MPHLRMFLGEQQIDELFISEVYLQSILRNHIIEEEKEKMLEKHRLLLLNPGTVPSFTLDSIPSPANNFTPISSNENVSQ